MTRGTGLNNLSTLLVHDGTSDAFKGHINVSLGLFSLPFSDEEIRKSDRHGRGTVAGI